MKTLPLLAASVLASALLFPQPGLSAGKDTLYVPLKNGITLRNAPQPFAPKAATLPFGADATVSEEKGSWVKLTTANGNSGWARRSVFSTRAVKVNTQAGTTTGASTDEIAMASKGFNEQVEKEFRTRNGTLNFKDVETMSKISYTEKALSDFLKKGGIRATGGAK